MNKPKIPMTPEGVPFQKVYSDFKLCARPASFQGRCNYLDPMDSTDHPAGSPRNIEYLGSVEWAWDPAHERFDSYYLNPRGKYWILWSRWMTMIGHLSGNGQYMRTDPKRE